MKGNITGAIHALYISVAVWQFWGVSPFPLTYLLFDHFYEFGTFVGEKNIGCRVTLCGVQPENSLFTLSR